MATNRKAQSMAVRFGPAVKAFLLCSVIAGTGVGYVNQKNTINLLSQRMAKLESLCDKQRLQRQILLRKLTALNSSNELENQVRRMNLDLSPTTPDRIVRLSTVPVALTRGERLFAGQTIPTLIRR